MDFSRKTPVQREEKPSRKAEPTVLSVSDLNTSLKKVLEGSFSLVWIRGEISNFTAHSSGHFYFSLKDKKSQVMAVMFRGANAHLQFKPKVGDEVIVRARVSVYVPRGNYQLVVEVMEPVGAGAMQRQFEECKARLEKEGLFLADRKKQIPKLPKKIAIITSPTGAAIKDILNVLDRRYRAAEVLLIPAVVQGQAATQSLLSALKMASELRDIDVLIIGRGGGSMEDLWCFNDETLARQIAAFRIPVISAVGHEIDFTICDFVADLRAPTPSAAAELVAKSVSELEQKIEQSMQRLLSRAKSVLAGKFTEWKGLNARLVHPSRRLQELSQKGDDLLNQLQQAMGRKIRDKSSELKNLRVRLGEPEHLVKMRVQKVQSASEKLEVLVQRQMADYRHRLHSRMSVLDSLSPLNVLDRGYSFVTDRQNRFVGFDELAVEQDLTVHWTDGAAEVQVKKVYKENRPWNLKKS